VITMLPVPDEFPMTKARALEASVVVPCAAL
jgi:hypothetical protein